MVRRDDLKDDYMRKGVAEQQVFEVDREYNGLAKTTRLR